MFHHLIRLFTTRRPRWPRPRPTSHRRRPQHLLPQVQSLEGRYAPACSWSDTARLLTCDGAADVITVHEIVYVPAGIWLLEIAFPGGTASPTRTASISIRAGGGNDTITVENGSLSSGGLNIQGEDGNDTVNFGNGRLDLIDLPGGATVNGGLGTDTLFLNDGSSTSARNYTLDSLAVTAGTTLAVRYSGMESLSLWGSAANNTINVTSTAVGTRTEVDGRAGNDTLQAVPAGIASDLTLRGDAGANSLTLDDSLSAVAGTYSLTASQLLRPGATRPISFSAVRAITLIAGAAGDTVYVRETAAGTSTAVHTRSGNDTVNVGGSCALLFVYCLDPIDGALDIGAGAGTDSLIVHDDAAPAGHTYLLSAGSPISGLARSGAATITYSGVENTELQATSYDDLILVAGTGTLNQTTLSAGAGNDILIGRDGGLYLTQWNITGSNAGTFEVQVRPPTASLGTGSFTGVENLVGGAGADTYVFANGQRITGFLYDAAGLNKLDYAAYTTPVYVLLDAFC